MKIHAIQTYLVDHDPDTAVRSAGSRLAYPAAEEVAA